MSNRIKLMRLILPLSKTKRKILNLLLVAYWIILFVATSLPLSSIPEIGVTDKLQHLTAYTLLAVLVNLTFLSQKKFRTPSARAFLFTLITIAIYGIFDELHQILIPGRSCDVLDITADIAGGIIGIAVVYIFVRR